MESTNKLPEAFAHFIVSFSILLKQHSAKDDELRISSNLSLVLHSLCAGSGRRITMSALAKELGIMKQQLTRLVNELEEMGLATRDIIPDNRRCITVNVTEKGRAKYDELMKMFAKQLSASYFSTLPDREIEDIVRSMTKLGELFDTQSQVTREKDNY